MIREINPPDVLHSEAVSKLMAKKVKGGLGKEWARHATRSNTCTEVIQLFHMNIKRTRREFFQWIAKSGP